MEYTLEYFIAKFEAIPEDQWTIGNYVDDKGCKCAYGHCGSVVDLRDTKESTAFFKLDSLYPLGFAEINDDMYGEHRKFGSTPKQRIVNYLKSLR